MKKITLAVAAALLATTSVLAQVPKATPGAPLTTEQKLAKLTPAERAQFEAHAKAMGLDPKALAALDLAAAQKKSEAASAQKKAQLDVMQKQADLAKAQADKQYEAAKLSANAGIASGAANVGAGATSVGSGIKASGTKDAKTPKEIEPKTKMAGQPASGDAQAAAAQKDILAKAQAQKAAMAQQQQAQDMMKQQQQVIAQITEMLKKMNAAQNDAMKRIGGS